MRIKDLGTLSLNDLGVNIKDYNRFMSEWTIYTQHESSSLKSLADIKPNGMSETTRFEGAFNTQLDQKTFQCYR